MIGLGCARKPVQFVCKWPAMDTQSEQEKATVMNSRVTAYVSYLNSPMADLIAPMDFMTKFDGMTEEEAMAVLSEGEKHAEEKAIDDQVLADEHGLVPTVPGFEQPPEKKDENKPPFGKGQK